MIFRVSPLIFLGFPEHQGFMKGAVHKPKPKTEPELRGIVGNRSKPETGKTGNRGNRKPGARYRIPAGQPENRTGTGSRIPDNRPGNWKTGLGPEAGYRITGQPAGKPDWNWMLGTG